MDNATYKVLIKPEPTGGFVAEVPELPGCLSEGETVDEVLANIQEAIVGVLEMRHEMGLPDRVSVKKPIKKRVFSLRPSGIKKSTRRKKGSTQHEVTVQIPA